MNFHKTILDAVGKTPLVKLNRINKNLKPQIFAKLESANPGGSVKDRIGISMIEYAEKMVRLNLVVPLSKPQAETLGLD